jgi:3-hydroxyacyl-[acyl-carrier-protein] dehydratase
VRIEEHQTVAPAVQPACTETALDCERLRQVLAHRFPFLMLDKVTYLRPGKNIVALKNVTANEIHFLGHFPGLSIMPGVLIVEAMAQALHVLDVLSRTAVSLNEQGFLENYLSNVNVRFMKPVVPGDQMMVEAEIIKQVEHGVMGNAVVRVEERTVAKGEVILISKSEQSA